MPQQQRVRTIVGEPMTPDLMVRIGGLKEFPPTPGGFKPDGAWVNKYRVHTCHGYFESGNLDVGVLRLERVPDTGGFTLKLRQRIVNDEGYTQVADVWLRCHDDVLASPSEWRLMSHFEDVSGNQMAGLATEEIGRLAPGGFQILQKSGGKHITGDRPITSDWSLFEALQRLEFKPPATPEFDLLEGLTLHREKHRLGYRGLYRMKQKPGAVMHWFQQIGSGLLPYEYWLDDRHRLLAVGTQARAYVLDEQADEAVNQRLEEIRARRARRKNG